MQGSAAYDDREFQQSLVAAIYDAAPDGILVVDEHDVIVSHNLRLFEVFGIPPEEFPGETRGRLAGFPDKLLLSRVLQQVADPDEFMRRVIDLHADPKLSDQCEIPLRDGRTLERHSSALWGSGGEYFGRAWFFRDISERKRNEAELQKLLLLDPLTGVANRRHFFDRAGEEFYRARRFDRALSYIMLDVDWFKRVNDRWGHATGDRMLTCVCESALGALRKVDLFARVGGEEFAVLVPDTGIEGAFLLAERMRANVTNAFVEEGGERIRVTISAGVATLMPQDNSADDVLGRADAALYAAKNAGRDRTMRSD